MLSLCLFLLCVALVWAVTAGTLLLMAHGVGPPDRQELLIPPGAATTVRLGDLPVQVPASMSFVDGDVLRVTNEDQVTHRVGGYVVPPGRAIEIPVRFSAGSFFSCTFHPSGRLPIVVRPSGPTLRATALPALLLGVPLGVVALVVRRVVSSCR